MENVNLYGFYDMELDKLDNLFFATSDKMAERQFMLAIKTMPEEVRGSFVLRFIDTIDMFIAKSDSTTIAKGDNLQIWLNSHLKKKEDN